MQRTSSSRARNTWQKLAIVCAASALCCMVVVVCTGETPPPVTSLVAAEREFVAAVASQGAATALLQRVAPIAILLRPYPMNAHTWLASQPAPPVTWRWQPEVVAVSGAGDMGYTSGPWRAQAAAGSAVQCGDYLSVWRFHPQTGWKLLLNVEAAGTRGDAACDSAVRTESATLSVAAPGRPVVFPHDSLLTERDDLLRADSVLTRAAAQVGYAAALAAVTSEDITLVHAGVGAAAGRAAVTALWSRAVRRPDWAPAGGRTADSADLGYTYGTCRGVFPAAHGAAADSSALWSYVHIWRRDFAGHRRLVCEIAVPRTAGR